MGRGRRREREKRRQKRETSPEAKVVRWKRGRQQMAEGSVSFPEKAAPSLWRSRCRGDVLGDSALRRLLLGVVQEDPSLLLLARQREEENQGPLPPLLKFPASLPCWIDPVPQQ